MINNDDEKTKPLYDLEEINSDNQIFELEEKTRVYGEPLIEEGEDMKPLDKPIKEKLSLKDRWNKLSKKQKIIMVISLVVVLVLLIGGIILLVNSSKKEQPVEKKQDVIVQEDNYRYENGKLIFLDSDKKEIGTYDCKNPNENTCYVAYYSNEDEFDIENKINENKEKIKFRSTIVSNRYVFINDNTKDTDTSVTLYDIKESKDIDNYNLVKKGNDNNYILKDKSGMYGLVDLTEEITNKIDFKMEYLGYINNKNNYYIAKEGLHQILVKVDGTTNKKVFNGNIKNINDNYVKLVNNEGKYEVYDFNAKNIFNESFQYVEIYNDYVALINDNKLTLRFYDKSKLSEEGINLTNTTDFVKVSIYDENNKLIDSKEAFYLEDNNNIITITTSDKTTTINKLEGLVSKNLKYINYFDGKLYFYSDLDKKELLGSYNCANKNNVKEGANTLDNCYVASDTIFEDNDAEIPGNVGLIPLFNEKFVFVKDNPDLVNDSNKNIVLYDLKKNNTLGQYKEVNSYSYTGVNELSFKVVNDLQVIAKNKSDKFGVIKIGLSEVKGHINFNYNEMESLRDYYVARDVNGYVLLRKKDGSSEERNAVNYKIRNYNEVSKILKVKNNDKYFLKRFSGGDIELKEKSGYKYIELYDKFFATVDSNNKLELFTYEKPTSNLIQDKTIILNNNNYYGNGTLAFKINVNGSKYEIMVGTTDNTYTSEIQKNLE